MANFRYRTLDLPPNGAGAFCPLASMPPPSSSSGQSTWGVSALLGTVPVPVSNPLDGLPPLTATDRRTQPSAVSPNYILPDQYVVRADQRNAMQPPVPIRNFNNVPVPAETWINTPKPAMIQRKTGGRHAIAWPRPFQRWPSMTRGQQNA